jgi:PadR family transcriptional regulator PadR
LHVSKVEVVVLGLLFEEPMYGYELLERFRTRGMGAWIELGKASVYQALRRLEVEGSISSKLEAGTEGPDRRVYRLARPGRDRLRRGVLERIGDLEGDGSEAAVALGFAHVLAPAEARKALATHEASLRWRLARFAEQRANVAGGSGAASAIAVRMLSRQDALMRADLTWLTSFRKGLGRLK